MKTALWSLVLGAIILPNAFAQGSVCPDDSEQKITMPDGQVYYIDHENRVDHGLNFYFRDSMWRETNDVPGLQTGGVGLFGDYFPPGCDQTWEPGSLTTPCLLIDEYPIDDDCMAAPDEYVL